MDQPIHKEEGDPDMLRKALIAVAAVGLLAATAAFAQPDLLTRARQQFKPIPENPPALPDNPATPAKVELGKMLYDSLHALHLQEIKEISLRCNRYWRGPQRADQRGLPREVRTQRAVSREERLHRRCDGQPQPLQGLVLLELLLCL